MPKGWTDKTEYDRIKSQLFEKTGLDFERAALPLIRLLYPQAFQVSARKTLDRRGIDLVVWGISEPYPLAIQCKGFGVDEREIGDNQIDQCVASIEKFRDSGIETETYLLVYNRDARNADFRAAITTRLAELKASGRTKVAEHWPIDRLIQQAFRAMFERVKQASASHVLGQRLLRREQEPDLCDPLKEVPIETVQMVANQYRLMSSSSVSKKVADPAKVLEELKSRLTVIVGEAGFGKTTVALRVSQATSRHVIYANAASLNQDLKGTKDLLEQAVDVDILLEDASPEDRSTWHLLARAAIEHLLKTDDKSLLFILDALDESVFLLRQGGLQFLFNILRLVKTPVVLVTRVEHWNARQADFGSSVGILTGNPDREHNQYIDVIHLLPWSNDEIRALALRYQSTLGQTNARRIAELVEIIGSAHYETLYGDIPKRPLFLGWILETVAENGVHAVTKPRLVEEFARLKIARDYTRPAAVGGKRIPILEDIDGLDATIDLAFAVMEAAAVAMTQIEAGELQLLPTCTVADVVAQEPNLHRLTDPTGLVLNTLLVPAGPRLAPQPLALRFAHRAYQEYFLARRIAAKRAQFLAIKIPAEVEEWVREIDHST